VLSVDVRAELAQQVLQRGLVEDRVARLDDEVRVLWRAQRLDELRVASLLQRDLEQLGGRRVPVTVVVVDVDDRSLLVAGATSSSAIWSTVPAMLSASLSASSCW
jgi:hypothetical protein